MARRRCGCSVLHPCMARRPARPARRRRSPPALCKHRAMPTVLVIDDNRSIATALDVLLSLHEIDTLHADSPQAGLALLEARDVDLVIQDMNFAADTTSGEEGSRLFRDIRARHPDLLVIFLTAWTHLDMAVEMIKAGAADYVAKPWNDERLVTTVCFLVVFVLVNRVLVFWFVCVLL